MNSRFPRSQLLGPFAAAMGSEQSTAPPAARVAQEDESHGARTRKIFRSEGPHSTIHPLAEIRPPP
ncbi:MAG: hypothetical protein JW719_03775 [Pirellulales bacterium]|nr:hypothetical protein [Pirellulales bacterium]